MIYKMLFGNQRFWMNQLQPLTFYLKSRLGAYLLMSFWKNLYSNWFSVNQTHFQRKLFGCLRIELIEFGQTTVFQIVSRNFEFQMVSGTNETQISFKTINIQIIYTTHQPQIFSRILEFLNLYCFQLKIEGLFLQAYKCHT